MATGTYEYQSDFARKYVAEGKAKGEAKGKAEGILAVLSARGIGASEEERERISGCADLETLDGWIRRAAIVGTTAELFVDGRPTA